MVSYIPAGRAGNALFQCAMTIQYALKHDLDFHIPAKTNDKYWNPIYFPHLQNPNYNERLPRVVIQEKTHAYHEVEFQENWRGKNILLSGYWQSEKYFLWCKDEILKAFNLPWNPHNNVSIHVRRGDYLLYPDKHPVVSDEFYSEAIKTFVLLGYREFHVFSDDIKWCKEYFPGRFPEVVFVFSSGRTEMEDLIGISNCAAGGINSSSTFSWWGQYLNLNPSKVVLIPKQWFVDGHGNLDTKDIIPESWIKI